MLSPVLEQFLTHHNKIVRDFFKVLVAENCSLPENGDYLISISEINDKESNIDHVKLIFELDKKSNIIRLKGFFSVQEQKIEVDGSSFENYNFKSLEDSYQCFLSKLKLHLPEYFKKD